MSDLDIYGTICRANIFAQNNIKIIQVCANKRGAVAELADRIIEINDMSGAAINAVWLLHQMQNDANKVYLLTSHLDSREPLVLDKNNLVGVLVTCTPQNFNASKLEPDNTVAQLLLEVEALNVGFNTGIEVLALLTEPKKGFGTIALDFVRTKNATVVLESTPSAFLFYTKYGFVHAWRGEGNMVLPYLYHCNEEPIVAWYRYLDANSVQHIKNTFQDGNNIEDESGNPKDVINTQFMYSCALRRFFENKTCIPMFLTKELHITQTGGGSSKVLYKSYHYKIRQDRYGKYIITKNEGRVPMSRVKKWASHHHSP